MFFHGYYAIRFMVCNEALPTSCAHGQEFKKNYFTMANNAFHNLVFRKVNKLIIIHLEECPCDWIVIVWLPSQSLFPQVLQVCFNMLFINTINITIISWNLHLKPSFMQRLHIVNTLIVIISCICWNNFINGANVVRHHIKNH
jgi:hypothetical protein